MSHEPDIFGYLATTKISGITTALLDDSAKNSYAAKKNIPFWKGPISIWATVRASRTYPAGIVIPEAGTIESVSMPPGETAILQPPGTEVWHIKGIVGTGVGGTATCNVSYSDGVSSVIIDAAQPFTTAGNRFTYSATPPITGTQPLTISNSLYLEFEETGGAQGVLFLIAIHKVSL